MEMGSKVGEEEFVWGHQRVCVSVVCLQIILSCKICTPIVSLLHYTKLYQGHTKCQNKTPTHLKIFQSIGRNWMLLCCGNYQRDPETLDLPPNSNPSTPISSQLSSF
ncbi:hypothetical protein C1H46_025027 [Malus baccata]|uniref:Uncharacterized protein n=1 Tax=Malus baccata TaxID=106549 RepID=A0A540LS94_MALBA|nr:hypothetical protein C1H46_025027 [Malus baccata]